MLSGRANISILYISMEELDYRMNEYENIGKRWTAVHPQHSEVALRPESQSLSNPLFD